MGLMGRFSGALGVLVGVVLFSSGWFCLHRGGFVYIGAALFTSGWFCFGRGGFVLHRGGFIFVGASKW